MPEFTPIGVIHSPFKAREHTPVQPAGGADVPAFEAEDGMRTGWLETATEHAAACRADDRFK